MSIADELEQLEKLRRNGTLSEEEFRLAKQRVISGESDQGTRFTAPEFFEPADRVMAERRLGMFLHLSMLLGLIIPGAGFAVPIIIWQVKKDEYESIDQHGRNATNWLCKHTWAKRRPASRIIPTTHVLTLRWRLPLPTRA